MAQQQQADGALGQSSGPASAQEAAPAHEPAQHASDSQLAAGQGSINILAGQTGADKGASASAEQAGAGTTAVGQAEDAARSAEIRAASERVPNMDSSSTIALGAAPGGKPSGPAPSSMNAAAAATPLATSAVKEAEEPGAAGDCPPCRHMAQAGRQCKGLGDAASHPACPDQCSSTACSPQQVQPAATCNVHAADAVAFCCSARTCSIC